MKRKFTKMAYAIGIAVIAGLAGMILYIITSTTGYLASSSMNLLPVISTAAALAIMLILIFGGERLTETLFDLAVVLVNVLLLVCLYYFIMGRVSLAADVYFIPVNYPTSEAAALHISIAGAALYLIADLAMVAVAFMKRKGEK